jgi:hypothetical protein
MGWLSVEPCFVDRGEFFVLGNFFILTRKKVVPEITSVLADNLAIPGKNT